MPWYLDTSAAVKLITEENESVALRGWLMTRAWTMSDVHRTELRRATARLGARAAAQADALLDSVDLVRVGPDVFNAAGTVGPQELRSLDALHIAAAQMLGPDLAGIVAYDDRLLAAATVLGIEVASPGVD